MPTAFYYVTSQLNDNIVFIHGTLLNYFYIIFHNVSKLVIYFMIIISKRVCQSNDAN